MDTKTASAFLFFGFLLVPAMFKKDLKPESWEEDFAKLAGTKDPAVIERLLKNCAGRIIRLGSEAKPKWAFVYQKYIAVEAGQVSVLPLGGWGEMNPHDVRRMMDVAKVMGIEWSEPMWMLGVQEIEPPVGESVGGSPSITDPPKPISSEPSSEKPPSSVAGSPEVSPPSGNPIDHESPGQFMGESSTSPSTEASPPETSSADSSGSSTTAPESSPSELSGGPSDEAHPGLGPDDLIDPNEDYSDVP